MKFVINLLRTCMVFLGCISLSIFGLIIAESYGVDSHELLGTLPRWSFGLALGLMVLFAVFLDILCDYFEE